MRHKAAGQDHFQGEKERWDKQCDKQYPMLPFPDVHLIPMASAEDPMP